MHVEEVQGKARTKNKAELMLRYLLALCFCGVAVLSVAAAMSACDLSMLPLEHKHITQLSQGLHLLQHLDLSGCKKLQPGMTQQLLQGLASKQLQSLNLQRCFQLTYACLTDLLEYAASSHSSSKALQCIALSHLNLPTWLDTAAAADGRSSNDGDSNNSPSRVSSSGSDSDAGAARVSNNASVQVAGEAGSTAADWAGLAGSLMVKLPRQLGAPLLTAGSATALRVVVLNNCSLLSLPGLISLGAACPQLEYLFLGGSTLKTPELPAAPPGSGAAALQAAEARGVYVPRSVAASAAAAGGAAASATLELPGALQQLSELLQLPQTLPWEVLSSCCDADSDSSDWGQAQCSCACSCCSSARIRAQRRDGAGSDVDDTSQQRARKRLHRNEPSTAAVATARGHALSLAYVAALLPGLKALEVTFMAPGLAGWLRVCLMKLQQVRRQQQNAEHCSLSPSHLDHSGLLNGPTDSGRGAGPLLSSGLAVCAQRPKVWQFSCVTAVADSLQTLACARRAFTASGSSVSSSGGDGSMNAGKGAVLHPDCLSIAVRCAVNCSSRGRSTPLHMAADAGCAYHIKELMAAGAAVPARDASGASALFVACESGQAAAAAVLLEAGADALVGNTAGETPLYIAALRGHLSVVEVLLGHLSAADVDWTQRQLYGDAWTPLMAAAVANRVSITQLVAAAVGFAVMALFFCMQHPEAMHVCVETPLRLFRRQPYDMCSSVIACSCCIVRR
jgi:hypothetical protein